MIIFCFYLGIKYEVETYLIWLVFSYNNQGSKTRLGLRVYNFLDDFRLENWADWNSCTAFAVASCIDGADAFAVGS